MFTERDLSLVAIGFSMGMLVTSCLAALSLVVR